MKRADITVKKKVFITVLIIIVCLAATDIAAVFGINAYVKRIGGRNIITSEEAAYKNADCIVVLGCQVKEDGKPSDMLSDRIKRGIELYKKGAAPKIIMSGDHGRKSYDEVNAMKQAAVDSEVPSSDVFMDHAGFSTYDSIYRAKEIFEADRIIVVTQKYHLYRALYQVLLSVLYLQNAKIFLPYFLSILKAHKFPSPEIVVCLSLQWSL